MHTIDLASFLQVLSEASQQKLSYLAEKAMALIEMHEAGNSAHVLSTESLHRCWSVVDAATAP